MRKLNLNAHNSPIHVYVPRSVLNLQFHNTLWEVYAAGEPKV